MSHDPPSSGTLTNFSCSCVSRGLFSTADVGVSENRGPNINRDTSYVVGLFSTVLLPHKRSLSVQLSTPLDEWSAGTFVAQDLRV